MKKEMLFLAYSMALGGVSNFSAEESNELVVCHRDKNDAFPGTYEALIKARDQSQGADVTEGFIETEPAKGQITSSRQDFCCSPLKNCYARFYDEHCVATLIGGVLFSLERLYLIGFFA